MNWDLQSLPSSARTALFSLAVVAIAYVAGKIAYFFPYRFCPLGGLGAFGGYGPSRTKCW